jgi:flagellar FliJ protein
MREGNLMLLRLKRLEAIQKEKVALLETMMIEFNKMAADLAEQIAVEEESTRNRDSGHFAYSTFAKAATLRRCNLMNSVTDIKSRLDVAKRELEELTVQLRDLELARSQAPSIRTIATTKESQSNKLRPAAAPAESMGSTRSNLLELSESVNSRHLYPGS